MGERMKKFCFNVPEVPMPILKIILPVSNNQHQIHILTIEDAKQLYQELHEAIINLEQQEPNNDSVLLRDFIF